jgi:hypothetical protein
VKHSKNHFFAAFLTFVFSIGTFYAFEMILPNRLFAEIKASGDNIVVDSLAILAMAEEAEAIAPLVVAIAPLVETIAPVAPAASVAKAVPVAQATQAPEVVETSNTNPLNRFFAKLLALEKNKKGTVRIAYFGDSMIESDLMVQDIRRSYQNKYGGHGKGFVMLSNVHKPVDATVRYEYSPQWITHTFLKTPPVPVGVSGYVSVAKNNMPTWTRYKKGSSSLVNPVLFYGQSANDSATITVIADGDTSILEDLQIRLLNKRQLTSSSPKELMLQFNNVGSTPFYGVDFSGSSGVYIDNFPMRSSSGLPLSTFDVELMNAFQQELKYDLIILQFGLNVLNTNSKAYGWYTTRMTNAVEHLKACFPGVDVLVISSPDRATKYGTEMETDSSLVSLLRAQERYAKNANAGFISLFRLMGGAGSMIKWADEGMAAQDYAHFTAGGARKAAGLIFGQMERDFERFKKQNVSSKSEGVLE